MVRNMSYASSSESHHVTDRLHFSGGSIVVLCMFSFMFCVESGQVLLLLVSCLCRCRGLKSKCKNYVGFTRIACKSSISIIICLCCRNIFFSLSLVTYMWPVVFVIGSSFVFLACSEEVFTCQMFFSCMCFQDCHVLRFDFFHLFCPF